MAAWCERARVQDVGEVAKLLGLEIKGWGGRSLTPCPACREVRRGKTDPRGAVGMTSDRRGWRCQRCLAGGDCIGLVSWQIMGAAPGSLDRDGWRELRAWFADRGLCDPWEPKRGRGARRAPQPPPLAPPPPSPPLRPPEVELAALLAECRPPGDVPEVAAWLRRRAVEPGACQVDPAAPLVWALPRGAACPVWAGMGDNPWRPWSTRGYQALLPLYDAAGHLTSVRARSVRAHLLPTRIKEAAPRGFDGAGLVFADEVGLSLLRGAPAARWDGRVVIVEGGPDWLTWASRGVGASAAPAVFGVGSGSWTADHAAKIPAGATVVIRTHHDEAGDRYAQAIGATLPHVVLYRSHPDAG